jgi:hypothetical protein
MMEMSPSANKRSIGTNFACGARNQIGLVVLARE